MEHLWCVLHMSTPSTVHWDQCLFILVQTKLLNKPSGNKTDVHLTIKCLAKYSDKKVTFWCQCVILMPHLLNRSNLNLYLPLLPLKVFELLIPWDPFAFRTPKLALWAIISCRQDTTHYESMILKNRGVKQPELHASVNTGCLCVRDEGVAFLIIYWDVMPRGHNPAPLLPDLLRVGLTVAFLCIQ